MTLEIPQLAFPCAAFSFVGAEHAKIQHLSLELFVEHGIERLLADRTGIAGSFDPTDARSASFVTAATEEIGVSEWKQAHGTLKKIGRGVHEVTLVPSGKERSARIVVSRHRHHFSNDGRGHTYTMIGVGHRIYSSNEKV